MYSIDIREIKVTRYFYNSTHINLVHTIQPKVNILVIRVQHLFSNKPYLLGIIGLNTN